MQKISPYVVGQVGKDDLMSACKKHQFILAQSDLASSHVGYIEFYADAISMIDLWMTGAWSQYLASTQPRLMLGFMKGDSCNGYATLLEGIDEAKPCYIVAVDAGSVPRIVSTAYAIVSLLRATLTSKPFHVNDDTESFAWIANAIAKNAILLLFFHECGHCFQGHLPLWKSLFGTNVAGERPNSLSARSRGTVRGSRLRRIIEVDADDFSALNLGHGLSAAFHSSTPLLPNQSLQLMELVLHLSAFALSICLAREHNEPTNFYHSPFTRSMHIGSALRSSFLLTTRTAPVLGNMFLVKVMIEIYKVQFSSSTPLIFDIDAVLPDLETWFEKTYRDVIRLRRLGLIKGWPDRPNSSVNTDAAR